MTLTHILTPIDSVLNATPALREVANLPTTYGATLTVVGADLVVTEAHGTADGKPAWMGSVAEKVVRDAPCSVLTVRAPSQTQP